MFVLLNNFESEYLNKTDSRRHKNSFLKVRVSPHTEVKRFSSEHTMNLFFRRTSPNCIKYSKIFLPLDVYNPSRRSNSTCVSDPFIHRHLGSRKDDVGAMLRTIGISSIERLMELTIPPQIRSVPETQRDIHPEMRGLLNERRATEALKKIAQKNSTTCKSLLGQGFVNSTTPAVLRRLVIENPGWYTSYTPYQPEISQGRLEALLTFQVM